MLKKIISVLISISILLFGMARMRDVFSTGDIYMKAFYEQEKDSIDVLILGSSRAWVDIEPTILWDQYGITSFGLGASCQSVCSSFFYLKEAIKTQKPEVVVFEGSGFKPGVGETDIYRQNSLFSMKLSLNKLDAIKAIVPERKRTKFLFEYIYYHNRYSSLTIDDYMKQYKAVNRLPYPDYKVFKGSSDLFWTQDFSGENLYVENRGERLPLDEKAVEYYEKIIDLCRDNEIALITIISPYAGYNSNDAAYYNSSSDLASEHNIPFINFNEHLTELSLDPAQDYAEASHLNWCGTKKFSVFLGDYLMNHYDLTDHRPDYLRDMEGIYSTWESSSKFYHNAVRDYEYSQVNDCAMYFVSYCDIPDDIFAIVKLDDPVSLYSESVKLLLSRMGITVEEAETPGMWLITENGAESLDTTEYGYRIKKEINGCTFAADNYGIYWRQKNYIMAEKNLNILLFDKAIPTVADSVTIDYDGSMSHFAL